MNTFAKARRLTILESAVNGDYEKPCGGELEKTSSAFPSDRLTGVLYRPILQFGRIFRERFSFCHSIFQEDNISMNFQSRRPDCKEIDLKELADYPAILQLSESLWNLGKVRGAAIMVGAGFSRNAERPSPLSPEGGFTFEVQHG